MTVATYQAASPNKIEISLHEGIKTTSAFLSVA
jgi:hypothetical protein